MTHELKLSIVAAAATYMAEKNLSLNELCRQSNINVGYLSPMLRNQFLVLVKDKQAAIAPKWFETLARYIGFPITDAIWKTIATRQFVAQIAAIQGSKNACKTAMIIGSTGAGKTYNTNVFCNKEPLHTYRITVSSLYKLVDIINELTEKLDVNLQTIDRFKMDTRSIKIRVDRIVAKLIDIKRNGGNPIIIFDEGENMEMGVLKMLKGLYDALNGHCGITVIGTEQLLNKLLNLRKRNRDAIPQLYRRFKAGMVMLPALNKQVDFLPFFEAFNVEPALRKLLTDICDNYGELYDYLEPSIREAQRLNKPLTEQLFRTINNISNNKMKAA